MSFAKSPTRSGSPSLGEYSSGVGPATRSSKNLASASSPRLIALGSALDAAIASLDGAHDATGAGLSSSVNSSLIKVFYICKIGCGIGSVCTIFYSSNRTFEQWLRKSFNALKSWVYIFLKNPYLSKSCFMRCFQNFKTSSKF